MINLPTWDSIEKDITPDLINNYYEPNMREIAQSFRQVHSSLFDTYRTHGYTSTVAEYQKFNDVITTFKEKPDLDKATEYLISYIHVDTNKWCHANAVKLRMLNSYSFAYKAYVHKDSKIQKYRAKHTQYAQLPMAYSHCLNNWYNKGGASQFYSTPASLNPFGSFFYLIPSSDIGFINKRSYAARRASSIKVIGGECLISFRRYYAENIDEVIANNEIPGVKSKTDLRATHVDFNFRTFDLRSASNNRPMHAPSVEDITSERYYARKRCSFLIYTRNSKPL